MGKLDKLQQTLHWIDSNLHRLSIEDLRRVFGDCLPRLPFSLVDFDNRPFFFHQREYGGLNVIYRARKITNPGNTFHRLVSDLSYMPSNKLHLIADYGRVNKPQQAMFYGAFNPMTAIIEVLHADPEFISTKSAFVTISIWKIVQPLTLADILLSESKHRELYKELGEIDGFTSKFEEGYFESQKQWLNKFTDLERVATEYFAGKFCESNVNNLHYKCSNYYADRIFGRYEEHPYSGQEEIDGILYSSVANSYQEQNIVLRPEAVNSKLEFLAAEAVVVFGGGQLTAAPIDRAHADSEGNLLWQKEEWQKKQAR